MSYIINNDESWGQFIDIESGYIIPEQLVTAFKTQRPIKNPIPVPLIKSILKPSSTKPFIIIPSPRPSLIPNKTDHVDTYNDALDKIIERQIYLGCFICILTLGIFIMP
jgi:hypothetical protein